MQRSLGLLFLCLSFAACHHDHAGTNAGDGGGSQDDGSASSHDLSSDSTSDSGVSQGDGDGGSNAVDGGSNAGDGGGSGSDGGSTGSGLLSVGTNYLTAVWGSSASDVWIGGFSGTLLHTTDGGKTFTQPAGVLKVQGATYTVNGIWGSGPNDIYLSGGFGSSVVLHSTDGFKTFSTYYAPIDTAAVWGPDANDVYVVGTSAILYTGDHGGTYTEQAVGLNAGYGGVSGTASGMIYAAGSYQTGDPAVSYGRVVYGSNGGWSYVETPGIVPYDIWVDDATDMYIVGVGGAIQHSTDGKSWSAISSGVSNDLLSVWGSGASDVWISSRAGLLLHGSLTGFTPVATGSTNDLACVWGSGPHDVWAVGAAGTIFHYTN